MVLKLSDRSREQRVAPRDIFTEKKKAIRTANCTRHPVGTEFSKSLRSVSIQLVGQKLDRTIFDVYSVCGD